jgi:hypothetical protein
MSNELKGKDFVLYLKIGVQFYPVACSTNVSVTTTSDKIELAPYSSGAWRKFIYGRLTGTIQGQGIAKLTTGTELYGIFDLIEKQHERENVLARYVATDDLNKEITYQADCIIDEINITGTVGQFCNFNFSLTISGKPEIELYLIADNLDINIADNNGNLIMYNNEQFSDFVAADFEANDFNV